MTTPLKTAPGFGLDHETPFDARPVEALVAAAFGPGRFAKAAERVRERARLLPECSFVARAEGRVVGTVRLWAVRVGEARLAFLGPIAVDHAWRSEGVGAALVERACEAAQAAGLDGVLLVGDPPYFARFGFEPAPGVVLPAPVDPRRLLVRRFSGLTTAPVGPVVGG